MTNVDKVNLLADNVICQHSTQPFFELVESFREDHPEKATPALFRLIHVVNPFRNAKSRNHSLAQDFTFKTMIDAREFDNRDILHVSTQQDSDRISLPDSFILAKAPGRSVADIHTFKTKRNVPLLFDILDRGAEFAGQDDFIIYTNVDICLKPYFYSVVGELLQLGFDALTINRRTIGDYDIYKHYPVLANAETGTSHPGFDCLVFKRSHYERFVKNHACVGTHYVMRGLLYNMVAQASRMLMLKNVDLTYHFGNDLSWQHPGLREYSQFNEREALKTLIAIYRDQSKAVRLNEFCRNHQEKIVLSITN